jgi:hypothetical protein
MFHHLLGDVMMALPEQERDATDGDHGEVTPPVLVEFRAGTLGLGPASAAGEHADAVGHEEGPAPAVAQLAGRPAPSAASRSASS